MRIYCIFQAMKMTKTSLRMQGESWIHQWQQQCHANRDLSKASIRETVVPKAEQAKASDAKTRFSCIAEADESTRKRIYFSINRIHKGHNAGKEHNSRVYYNWFARQLPPREEPNVTLRKRRVHERAPTLCACLGKPWLCCRSETPAQSDQRVAFGQTKITNANNFFFNSARFFPM